MNEYSVVIRSEKLGSITKNVLRARTQTHQHQRGRQTRMQVTPQNSHQSQVTNQFDHTFGHNFQRRTPPCFEDPCLLQTTSTSGAERKNRPTRPGVRPVPKVLGPPCRPVQTVS